MNSVRRADRRFLLARATALVLALCAAAGPACALELPELMALLQHHGSGQSRFTEQRFVKGLDQPLVASGTLAFVAPDCFERRTVMPKAESVVVQGNQVTLSRGGRSRTVALDAAPEAVIAVEAVRGTLTGNASVLKKWFDVKLAGDAAHWTLDLVPLDPAAAGSLRAVRIGGQHDELRLVETTLVDGDRTVMTVEPETALANPAAGRDLAPGVAASAPR